MMIAFIIILILGTFLLWREICLQRLRAQHQKAQNEVIFLKDHLENIHKERTYLQENNQYLQNLIKEHVGLLSGQHKDFEKEWQNVCNQALLNAQNSFMTLIEPVLSSLAHHTQGHLQAHSDGIKNLLHPLEKNLQAVSAHINGLEQARLGAYEGLKEQIQHLSQGQKTLYTETNALITALRSPHVRGCWGEMQLKRVVELAGMVPYCDFQEQLSLEKENTHLKPDMIIRLPGNKNIIVDAKAPLLYFLESLSAKTTQEYMQKLKEHARLLIHHIKSLADKKYWSFQKDTMEFTLLFLPGEAFLSAALEGDPSIIEYAAQSNIILSTPIILIALLKTIAFGWRQEAVSQQTQQIITLGKELAYGLEQFKNQMTALGKSLRQGTALHQEAVKVLENKLLPSCQQLSGLELPSQKVAASEQNLQASGHV